MVLLGFSRSFKWYTTKNAIVKQWCRSRGCNGIPKSLASPTPMFRNWFRERAPRPS